MVTARDAFQVLELANSYGIAYRSFGAHAGKRKLCKIIALLARTTQLLPYALRQKPDIALSHGARSQIMVANLLRIPSVEFIDYEHVATPPLCHPKWEIVPSCYDISKCRAPAARVRTFPGIKEDVYLASLPRDEQTLAQLQLGAPEILAVIRPPATEAHYHNAEAEALFERLMDRIVSTPGAVAVVLPRNRAQAQALQSQFEAAIRQGSIVIPKAAVNAQSLLSEADLVAGGGGTMTREACALGIPSYSFFRGPLGAIDDYLEKSGKLVMLRSLDDVENRFRIERRSPDRPPALDGHHPTSVFCPPTSDLPPSLAAVLNHIEEILSFGGQRKARSTRSRQEDGKSENSGR